MRSTTARPAISQRAGDAQGVQAHHDHGVSRQHCHRRSDVAQGGLHHAVSEQADMHAHYLPLSPEFPGEFVQSHKSAILE